MCKQSIFLPVKSGYETMLTHKVGGKCVGIAPPLVLCMEDVQYYSHTHNRYTCNVEQCINLSKQNSCY